MIIALVMAFAIPTLAARHKTDKKAKKTAVEMVDEIKEDTVQLTKTSVDDTMQDTVSVFLKDNWFSLFMIVAIVVIVVIVAIVAIVILFVKNRGTAKVQSANGITYKQLTAISMYFAARTRKQVILGNDRKKDIKDHLSSRLRLADRVDTLANELLEKVKSKSGRRSIANDPTLAIEDSDYEDEATEPIFKPSVNPKKQTEYRAALAKLEQSKKLYGSTKKLQTRVSELNGLDEIITRCWEIMNTIPSFNSKDFKFPSD